MNTFFAKYSEIFLILLFSFIFLTPGIQENALLTQGDESMHIVTIRESVARGNYFLPYLSGTPNPYKPPLLFWISEIFEIFFPGNLFWERFPFVLFGAMSSVFVYKLLHFFVENKLAFIGSILYLFSLGTFKFSRLAMMEQGMAFFILLVVYYFVKYFLYRKFKYIVIAGFVTGIGFLLKGPILHVYTGILIFTIGSLGLFRFNLSKRIWKGKKNFHLFLKVVFIFISFGFIVPVLYFISLALFNEAGVDLIKFFLIIENLGKFSNENQPEMSLVQGLLMYSLPWSIALVYGMYDSLFQKTLGRQNFIGQLFIITGILVLFLHLLPNRKEAYYMIPLIPVLFVGVIISLRNNFLLDKYWKLNLLSIHFFNLILMVILFWMDGFKNYLYIAIPVVYILILIWIRQFQIQLFYKNLILGIGLIIFFQFVILPVLHQPLLSKELAQNYPNTICVLSDNPWAIYELRTYQEKIQWKHGSPQFPETCSKLGYPILALSEHSPISGYEMKKKWKVYNSAQKFKIQFLFDSNQVFKEVKYYEMSKINEL